MSHAQNRRDELNIAHPPQLRADAAWALLHILDKAFSSRDVMPLIFARHGKASDRAWLQETVFGVLRVLPSLQVWLRLLLNKPLKKQQKIVEHVIMVGLFQQAFMRTSSHAAVSETVSASKVLKQGQLSGLVNAVLRNFERKDIASKPIESPHAKANLPKWLYKRLIEAYPDCLDALAEAMLQKAPLFLRINLLKIELKAYSDILVAEGIEHHTVGPRGIQLHKYTDVTSLPMFEEGGFSVQDLAAQHAADILEPAPGDIILDACAAPGGKTSALIEAQAQLGALYALDSVDERNKRTEANLRRLGHFDLLGDKLKIVNADASLDSTFAQLPRFDKILLDAPCSATGVIRRHPDIKWHRKASDIDALVALQASILETTWQALKPGGTLLYATCSILPEENTRQIKTFLDAHEDAHLHMITEHETLDRPGWQILPGEQNMDGFFYARLIKSVAQGDEIKL